MSLHTRLPYRDDDGALAGLNADLDRAMATLAGLIAAGHRTVVLERLAHLLSGGGAHPRSAVPEPAAEAPSKIDDRLALAGRLVALRRARRLKHARTLAPQLAAVAADLTAALTTSREDPR